MRFLIIHNRYQQTGGEDMVFDKETNLLESRGHSVQRLCVSNDPLRKIGHRFRTAILCHYSKVSRKIVQDQIKTHRPDLVHVHNFFPRLTPSIYDACINAKVPVVQTLHNYRTICPGALLMRHREICEKCVSGSPYNAVLYRCYRNSFIGSWAVARMVKFHRDKKTWQNKVDTFIVLTNFAKNKFIKAGFPANNIMVKPNFCKKTYAYSETQNGNGNALYVGRLSREKGLETTLKGWQDIEIPLRIAGKGQPPYSFGGYNKNNIKFLGHITIEDVYTEMMNADFLIMPSECYEGFPMVIVEAFAHGLPVIASKLGAMAEIIENGKTGLHFEPGNSEDLKKKVLWMNSHRDDCKKMGENARTVYEQKYTPEKNYNMLMDIYRKTIENYEVKNS